MAEVQARVYHEVGCQERILFDFVQEFLLRTKVSSVKDRAFGTFDKIPEVALAIIIFKPKKERT